MACIRNGIIAAILGRWQPVHLGHKAALESLCRMYDRVLIGIGSANIYDYRNPFHQEEVEAMLSLVLKGYDNYVFVPVLDMDDDQAWCREMADSFSRADVFYTANPYVTHLLQRQFSIAHPAAVIPEELKTPVSATMVRRGLARGEGWQAHLPGEVTGFILERKLDERFRRDFGLQTLVMETVVVN